MDFAQIFGVYSRRNQDSGNAPAQLTSEFRNRVVLLCENTFYFHFWHETHRELQVLHGRRILVGTQSQGDRIQRDDTIAFLNQCSDEHFLDFIELIFKTQSFQDVEVDSSVVALLERKMLSRSSRGPTRHPRQLRSAINEFIKADHLPYSLTNFVCSGYSITTYPQVIRRDSEVLHETAIEPTLKLLTNPVFDSANREFLNALKDYRMGDYPDCVAKCGSSFESVMKVICDQKGWLYEQNDTAAPLLDNIFPQTDLDSFFKQPIMLIATIRNRLSSAHGAGAEQLEVPEHVAHYAINATASPILLLVEETNP